jgi:predicted ribosomally synthesized peptide with SipW-like signal peptide
MIVLGCMGFVAGIGTWAIFTDSTGVPSNTFGSGTVTLLDDDGGGTSMFSMTGLQPAGTDSGCILVTYTGSTTANVRVYGGTAGTGLDQYLDLTVTRGTKTGAFDSCSGFTADTTNYIGQGAGVIYKGTLQGFPDDYNTGAVDPTSGSPEAWSSGEAHAYRLDVTLQNNAAAQGKNATQTFTWEARDA